MTTVLLKRIYHDHNNPKSYNVVDRLLKIERKLHIYGDYQKTVKEKVYNEQAYTLYKPAR